LKLASNIQLNSIVCDKTNSIILFFISSSLILESENFLYNLRKKSLLLVKIFHNNSQLWIKSSITLKKSFLSLDIIILYSPDNSSDLSFIKYFFAFKEKYTAQPQIKGS